MTDKQKRIADVIAYFESWCPPSLAEKWDNVGLQVGTLDQAVSGVLTTLDVTEAVVDEAILHNANLIIAHHPLLFAPPKKLDIDTPKGRVIQKLLKHDITVYAAHTNLDIVEGGVNDLMADALGLEQKRVFLPSGHQIFKKLIVFVPKTHEQNVKDALHTNGAGNVGNYDKVSFVSEGSGYFQPNADAQPFIGKAGELERVEEVRIEMLVPEENVSKAVAAMIEVHPYEEVAYDVYPVEMKGKAYGLGRTGKLPSPMTLHELAQLVKQRYDVQHVRVTGDASASVETVAVLGGSGRDYIDQAMQQADVYITGDLTFHETQDAMLAGLCLIDPGHYAEKIMKQKVADYLQPAFLDVPVRVSLVNTDPFKGI
ncbi:Nif3-like dinuclear metal center hexameric protein [Virgibacillus sp. 7505]|uniref:Nif3-like dinuclear metal center hexameric protein n=1 Tax=Virgibacillus sp. 7505 TaxID=2022548 RepID=UPI000BA7A4F2|nr:Nif3-like dinuclear metal center hexameric protein [Virgibacillus sp. 7505]PAE17169.1 Nif3-like dinuclear metal center hexameric protein [Virgibacillus sp. 7505]